MAGITYTQINKMRTAGLLPFIAQTPVIQTQLSPPLSQPIITHATEESNSQEMQKKSKPFKIPKYEKSPEVVRSSEKRILKIPIKMKWKPPKMITEETNYHIEYNVPVKAHKSDHNLKGGKFKCNWCVKAFRDTWNLDAHLRSHTNEKPFK
eukprot:493920_1